MKRCCAFGVLLVAACGAWLLGVRLASAEPYRPTTDTEVIERLRASNDSRHRELQALRVQLRRNPEDLQLAQDLAVRYLGRGRQSGDPRYNSYAQGVLSPWWHLPSPPPTVRTLRAMVLLSAHDYSGALHDLDLVLDANRQSAQAWQAQATALRVTGRYEEARQSCAALWRLTDQITAASCNFHVASLNGDARASFAALLQVASQTQNSGATTEQLAWAHTVLAEIAHRLGDEDRAARQFAHAIAVSEPVHYLRQSYVDSLLDRGLYREVVTFLSSSPTSDSLLIRRTIAERALRIPSYEAHIATLAGRFEQWQRHPDGHLRNWILYLLAFDGSSELALRYARENWSRQKEPADSRLLLRAVIAAKRPEAARETIEWLRHVEQEDIYLDALIALASSIEP